VVPEDVSTQPGKANRIPPWRTLRGFSLRRRRECVSRISSVAQGPRVFLRTKHWTIPNVLRHPRQHGIVHKCVRISALGALRSSSEQLRGLIGKRELKYSWRRLHTCDEPTHACVPLS